MTKTFIRVVSHRLANLGLPVMMPLGTTVDGSFFMMWSSRLICIKQDGPNPFTAASGCVPKWINGVISQAADWAFLYPEVLVTPAAWT